MPSLTVYCSSSTHLDPDFHAVAKIVGEQFAARGITLIYGGGGVGLMGEIARTCHAHGGRVVGIITHRLMEAELGNRQCDELLLVDTMRERKQHMMERGDGFLILPGGVGTYEEFFEVLAARIVDEHRKPIGIVNSQQYYDPLVEMLEHGVEHRFIQRAVLSDLLIVDPDPVVVIEGLIGAEQVPCDHERFFPMGKG